MLDRRSFLSLAAAGLSVTALVGCGGSPATSDDAPASDTTTEAEAEAGTGAVDTGKLIVGFDSSYPPYG